MTQDDRMETITDPAEIRATSDERGCCDCRTFDQHERECILPDERTTPAPVGAAVALDLDAVEAEFLRQCGGCDAGLMMGCTCSQRDFRPTMLALVAEVRRLVKYRDWWKASSLANAEDVRRLAAICHDWRDRSEAAEAEVGRLTAIDDDLSWQIHETGGLLERAQAAEAAEAEVVTLRARLAAVEALADQWADRKRSDGMSGNAWIGITLAGVAADLRAALATTGEGQ